MLPGALRLTKVLDTADEIATHRCLCQASRVDSYCSRTSVAPWHAPSDLVHHSRHIGRIKPRQKAIERGVVRNRVQSEGGTQLGVFAQTDLGLAKSPVLIPHQTKHGQQLRLRELPLAELRALRGQNRLTDFQSQTGKAYQSNLGHRDGEEPEQFQINPFSAVQNTHVPRMSTEPNSF